MKIAVFGSTGGNGRLILTEAMRRGHEVTAFARRPDALAEVTGLAAADQAAADQVIEASAVDWTILRATRLTRQPASRPPRLSAQLFTKGPYSLSRRAYVAALVDEAENSADIRHIINITGGTHV